MVVIKRLLLLFLLASAVNSVPTSSYAFWSFNTITSFFSSSKNFIFGLFASIKNNLVWATEERITEVAEQTKQEAKKEVDNLFVPMQNKIKGLDENLTKLENSLNTQDQKTIELQEKIEKLPEEIRKTEENLKNEIKKLTSLFVAFQKIDTQFKNNINNK